jgi:hypothetical protein
VSFAAITLLVASQRVFIVVSLHFVIDSVRKLLDTPSYELQMLFNVKGNSRMALHGKFARMGKEVVAAFSFFRLDEEYYAIVSSLVEIRTRYR